MTDQFNPSVPSIPLGTDGTVLAIARGAPGFVGGTTTLYSSACPVIVPSSGTMNDNGSLTGLSLLPIAYAFAYLFFPTGAVFAGSPSGFYYARFTDTAEAIIFNNLLLPGQVPRFISVPTPIMATGPGAYTQSTTQIALITINIPGGTLRDSGVCEIFNLYSFSNSANAKDISISYGGNTVQAFTITGARSYQNIFSIYNQGIGNRQVVFPLVPNGYGGSGSLNDYLSTNTIDNFSISVLGTLSVDTDYIVLEAFTARKTV